MITKDRIKTLAQEIGFHACGITIPKPIPEAEEALKYWSEQGKHGEMKYLVKFKEELSVGMRNHAEQRFLENVS